MSSGTLMPGHAPLKFHPFANLFPMLGDNLPSEIGEARRKSFRESLAAEQRHPIVLHRGLVLDGRNRYRELTLLNKPISYFTFTGSDRQALEYVIDTNLERRDLSDKDRAIIAAGTPVPVVEYESRRPKTDEAGLPLYQVAMVAMADGEADVIAIKVPGEPAGITQGVQVRPVALFANPWTMERSGEKSFGVAYRAARLEPVTTPAPNPAPAGRGAQGS